MTTDPNKPAPAVVITEERLREIVDPSRSRAYVAQDEGKSMATELLALRAAAAPQTSPSEAEFVAAIDETAEMLDVWRTTTQARKDAVAKLLALFRRAAASRPDDSGLIEACEAAVVTIESLADQQAMPDDYYTPTLNRLRTALARAKERP